jgi:hypothetical protein
MSNGRQCLSRQNHMTNNQWTTPAWRLMWNRAAVYADPYGKMFEFLLTVHDIGLLSEMKIAVPNFLQGENYGQEKP